MPVSRAPARAWPASQEPPRRHRVEWPSAGWVCPARRPLPPSGVRPWPPTKWGRSHPLIATATRRSFELPTWHLPLELGKVARDYRHVEAIPAALFLIITVLRGESANLLSIGAIDLGIIVDATVIMVENIFRHLAQAVRREVSEIRACSTSCASRCSSRPRPPTCSRSSAARRSNSNPFSKL
jgi:AcrB/AcrD/AcrF family